eukprot:NODE_330_length_2223_cov_358.904324_g261_i0.p1 GENE.NODE_330_length_2223_cov_358.904324_g261_i0~~NODE_330_length_2223_cov_358.904324_g261_i0.p1  ORF type:complete len:681 (+),score=319.89 NODE_330_length_2223_cov_358.904324_g261_i0:217-2043(+)
MIAEAAGAASREYITFLKQQQDLTKIHQRLQELLGSLEKSRREHMTDIQKAQGHSANVLRNLEDGSRWNLQSKYGVQNLINDCGLQLQPVELYALDKKPNPEPTAQRLGALNQIRSEFSDQEAYAPYKNAVEAGIRRLERCEKEVRASNSDSTDLASFTDAILNQLRHILASKSLTELLAEDHGRYMQLQRRAQELRDLNEQALDDGEMALAERYSLETVEVFEEVMAVVLSKIGTDEEYIQTTKDLHQVRSNNDDNVKASIFKVVKDRTFLKSRCEKDLEKIYALKTKVEQVESQTADKVADDRKQSDAFLAQNAQSQLELFAQLESIEKQLEQLEKERYKEVKRRVEEKEKDEHRKMEFAHFCSVADAHAAALDNTIRNCDTYSHCTEMVQEFINSATRALEGDLDANGSEGSGNLLTSHINHLEAFRGLYLEVGALVHKKDRRVAEIDKQIQGAHIQQELAAETYNPNAKKFSEAKKQLLAQREVVEEEMASLKSRAEAGLRQFKAVSEGPLREAGVEYVHPVLEQQQLEIERKAKMVEYKALALVGTVDNTPLQEELDQVKRELSTTRTQIASSLQNTLQTTQLPAIKGTSASVTGGGNGYDGY